ncbi:MAG: hypothetical protein QNK03_05260 [Myxococcota bacterium]|nr:hypothetical protein [Myxococcota bacterium]
MSGHAGVMTLTTGDYENVDPDRTCMPAGQGVGGIDGVLPAGEIVRQVVAEARRELARLGALA